MSSQTAGTQTAGAHTVVDSAGRRVTLPARCDRVYASGPPASVCVYVLKPQSLLGWPRALRPDEKPYLLPAVRELPATGRLTGRGNESNLESVLALKPDLIVDVGSVTPTYIDLADRIQKQTGIPYLLVDGRFDAAAESMRVLGLALGERERGARIAADIDSRLADAARIVAAVERARRPRVYLARGPDGLETGLAGSINAELIEIAGGQNVMTAADGRRGLARISLENLYLANPDTVLTWDPDFHASVYRQPGWQPVDAVARRRVFLSPVLPFGWIDRPPSLNRLLGVTWLLHLFHPDQVQGSLRDAVRNFHRLYYQQDPDDAALERLLRFATATR